MKILKKLTISITILMIILFSIVPPKITLSYVDPDKIGQAIADTALDFWTNHWQDTIYHYDSEYTRASAYQHKMTSGTASGYNYAWEQNYTNKYAIDCVGLVSMIMHHATGIGDSTFTVLAAPINQGRNRTGIPKYLQGNQVKYYLKSETSLKPGDIICWEDHVGIYVGNGMMVDSAGRGKDGTGAVNNDETTAHTISYRSVSSYYLGDNYYGVIRVNPDAVLNEDHLAHTWDEYSQGGGSENPKPIDPDVPDESDKYIMTTISGYANAKDFYYNGAPLSGEYLGQVKKDWVIEFLTDVMDWLVGIMTLGYKIQIVGWTTIVQNIANSIVSAISTQDSNRTITSERILFNDVQILDVNFFNLQSAGGADIQKDDVVYTLRLSVAQLYNNIRNIVIIVMLVILIYVGIRMALSSIAKDKAFYKKMLFGWIVGFIVVMFIHYYMVVIMNLNEVFVSAMQPEETIGTSMYEQSRAYAYQIPASKAWPGTIVYVFLVYYLVKLLIFYFKRLFIVYVLVLIAPILGAAYAMEMIKGKSKSLTMWMKEFAFNVLIQTIHVLIYCVFMSMILQFMKRTNIWNLMSTSILMILIINLMLRAEKIIKKIFGLKANTMKDIVDTMLSASSTLISAVAMTKPIYGAVKGKVADAHRKSVQYNVNRKYENLEKLYGGKGESQLAKDIQKEIEKQKKKEADQILAYDSSSLKFAKGVLGGLGGLVAAVPMTFEGGPVQGALGTAGALSALNQYPGGRITNKDIDLDTLNRLSQKYGFDELDMSHDLANIKLPLNSSIAFANIDETERLNRNAIVVEAKPRSI